MSQVNAIKNPDGIFVNTELFREEANHFLKYGYYCPDPWDSPAWKEYWEEQLKRCIEGYSSGGVYITGDHYGYLNFSQIKITPEFKKFQNKNENVVADKDPVKRRIQQRRQSKTSAEKEVTFPSFWSLDYNYFHILDIARWGADIEYYKSLGLEVTISYDHLNGGWHVIIGKSRRKGFSFKNGWVATNRYNTIRNSVTIIGAFDKKYLYPEGTMKMASDYINFLDEHTGWAKAKDFVNKVDHKRASYEEKDDNNISIEKGYKSTIMAVSFGDNPEAAIGKDGTLVMFEEAGKFPNLRESYLKTKPAMEDGIYTTGQMLIYGTGGDMENGTTDFAEMFYNPKVYKLLPFKNIWDNNVSESASCGFFVPDYWCKPGFIDENGNSDNVKAKEFEDKKRKTIIDESSGLSMLNEYIQQYPFSPEEAFLVTSTNDFPVVELRNQLNRVISNKLDIKKGQVCTIYEKDGDVHIKPDLKHTLTPIDRFPTSVKDKTGAIVIYEQPIKGAPQGLYKAGYDPYRQDQSSGESLGAFYIYKSMNQISYTGDTIVAEYVGRPRVSDIFNRNVMLLAKAYNLELMHENEVTEVKSYFKNHNALHLLASQPDEVISKNIKNSSVSRIYGIHMNDKLKDAGEKYINRWLLTVRNIDENGKKILNLERIYSVALLEELISYNRKGNFDRVMALMMVMFQIEEDTIESYNSKSSTADVVAEQLLNIKLN